MIINRNILAILRTSSNLQKAVMNNYTPSRQLSQLLLLNSLAKVLTERKYLMNNGLTAEFYKHFSNELGPVFLDVYDSLGKLGTMGRGVTEGVRWVRWHRPRENTCPSLINMKIKVNCL